MNTVRVHNHGPGGVIITDGNGNVASQGPHTGNVYATPITIGDVSEGSATVDAPTPAAPPPPADVEPQLELTETN